MSDPLSREQRISHGASPGQRSDPRHFRAHASKLSLQVGIRDADGYVRAMQFPAEVVLSRAMAPKEVA